MEKSIDCVEEKLIINKPLLQMYGHFIKIECNDIILYEGEIEKYNSIDIKANNSICRINLYIMVDGDYLFFDEYFIQKNILNIDSRSIEKFYNIFFRKVEEYIND